MSKKALPNQHHYTDLSGYNAIVSQPVWHFLAQQPPGNHPFGAYFTILPRSTPNLAQKLRIPKRKVAYTFEFTDAGDLIPIRGVGGPSSSTLRRITMLILRAKFTTGPHEHLDRWG